MPSATRLLLASVTLLLCAGCGEPRGMVSGKVTLNGAPLSDAEIEFSDGQEKYFGLSFESGDYQMDPGSEGGIPVGDYQVTVTRYVMKRGGKPLPPGEQGEMLKIDDQAVPKVHSAGTHTVSKGANKIDLAVADETP